jgi:hypothetical protein
MEYSGGGGIMSIPELRKSFERIQHVAKDMVNGPITDQTVAAFSKEWQRTFHKSIDNKEAKAYLEHIKSMGLGQSKRTLKKMTRKRQGGGGATSSNLGGAPLDSTTQPGVYGSYGDFLPYVARGFGVGIPIDSQTRPALPDPDLSVSKDVGSGAILKGGGPSSARKTTRGRKQRKGDVSRRNKQRGGNNFILRTEPTTVVHDAKTFWQGQPMPASPSVVDPGHRLLLP